MKATINFLLVAFLFLFGSAKTDVSSTLLQNDKMPISESNGWQKTGRFTINTEFPLMCGDNVIDYFVGSADIHFTERIENGEQVWIILTYSGSFVGKNTEEVFNYKEINKINIPFEGDYSFHINVKGDKGSHFIMSGSYLAEEPWVVFDKAICNY
jgi:hypothetical protein